MTTGGGCPLGKWSGKSRLLQVDTDEETGMDWEGGGCIYYCIEDEALQAREFGDVRVIV